MSAPENFDACFTADSIHVDWCLDVCSCNEWYVYLLVISNTDYVCLSEVRSVANVCSLDVSSAAYLWSCF